MNYFNFQFLQTNFFQFFQFSIVSIFYKTNNIKTKPSTRVKTYWARKIFHFGSTLGIKDEERMEKLLYIPLFYNFEINLMPILFHYISQV